MNQPAEKYRPTWKQGLLLFFGGIILAASCCAGAFTYNGHALGSVLAFGFVISIFVICFGVVSLIIRMIQR